MRRIGGRALRAAPRCRGRRRGGSRDLWASHWIFRVLVIGLGGGRRPSMAAGSSGWRWAWTRDDPYERREVRWMSTSVFALVVPSRRPSSTSAPDDPAAQAAVADPEVLYQLADRLRPFTRPPGSGVATRLVSLPSSS